MDILTRADEILLIAVLRLRDDAYGVTIVREVERKTGKKLKLGGLWVSLDNLAKRGLLTKSLGDPSPQRGGRSKIYYRLTHEGLKALEQVRNLNASLWKGISGSLKDYR